jgi:hypothetical protein
MSLSSSAWYGLCVFCASIGVFVYCYSRSSRSYWQSVSTTHIVCVAAALLLLCLLGPMVLKSFRLPALAASSPQKTRQVSSSSSAPVVHPAASGDSVVGGPSLSASFVNQVLAAAGSPAAGLGQSLYDLSAQYNVDDAYALAIFQHESTYGKYGAGAVNHSLGNIICAGYPTCNGRFRSYATWQEGFADFYRLIAQEYVARGLTTVQAILQVYAPPSENDTSGYARAVSSAMAAFRAGRMNG